MLTIGLLGAGRIGKIHGGNVVANRARHAGRRRRRRRQCRQGTRRGDRRQGRDDRRDHGRQGYRRGADLHADGYPRRPDRARRESRQGGILREAGQPRRQAHRGLPRRRQRGQGQADDRLQPPLRSELRRRETPHRRGRGRQRRAGDDPVARSVAAAGQLHRTFGRAFPRHDDPRSRHGALSARRRAGRGSRGRFQPRRSGDRKGRRRRYRRRDAENGVRQDRADFQFAPRHLWLRSAHRGPWQSRIAGGRQPHFDHRHPRRRRRAIPATRRCPSSWSAMPKRIAWSLPPSLRRCSTARQSRRPARTG